MSARSSFRVSSDEKGTNGRISENDAGTFEPTESGV